MDNTHNENWLSIDLQKYYQCNQLSMRAKSHIAYMRIWSEASQSQCQEQLDMQMCLIWNWKRVWKGDKVFFAGDNGFVIYVWQLAYAALFSFKFNIFVNKAL